MIMYHGTRSKPFEKFELRPGKRHVLFSDFEVHTPGHFFSPHIEEAREFGPNVAKVDVDVRNPFWDPDKDRLHPRTGRLHDEKHVHLAKLVASAVQKDEGGHFLELGLRKHYLFPRDHWRNEGLPEFAWAYQHLEKEGLPWDLIDHPETTRRLLKLGYDSTWVHEPELPSGRSLYVPHPAKVKILGWSRPSKA